MSAAQPGATSRQGVATLALDTRAAIGANRSAPEPLPSTAVLRGHKSVSIEHEGVIYRLQVTKLGKLILTK